MARQTEGRTGQRGGTMLSIQRQLSGSGLYMECEFEVLGFGAVHRPDGTHTLQVRYVPGQGMERMDVKEGLLTVFEAMAAAIREGTVTVHAHGGPPPARVPPAQGKPS